MIIALRLTGGQNRIKLNIYISLLNVQNNLQIDKISFGFRDFTFGIHVQCLFLFFIHYQQVEVPERSMLLLIYGSGIVSCFRIEHVIPRHDFFLTIQKPSDIFLILHPCIDNPLSPLIGEMIGIAFICLEKFI